MPHTVWTPELNDRGAELWALGQSASLVADKLNREFGMNFSREAVIGRKHRHNWPGRPVREQKPRKDRGPNPRVRVKKAKPIPPRTIVVEIPLNPPITLLDLTWKTCRWPVGEPDAGMMYCGAERGSHGPYCEWHRAKGTSPGGAVAQGLRDNANGLIAGRVGLRFNAPVR